MIAFSTTIKKFGDKGEKTGWTYITIGKRLAEELKPGQRVSFRIKGKLDHHAIEKLALLPMGNGDYILPLNGTLRRAIGKKAGDKLRVKVEVDDRTLSLSADFVRCLKDDATAYDFFNTLPRSHQRYFSKWIESAKTNSTKVKRITMAVVALSSRQGYNQMLRANRTLR